MDYKELQEEAKRLGLKHIGVSKKKLEKMIEQEKAEDSDEQDTKSTEVEKPEKENKKVNAAVVYNGKHEVRRYTVEIHGKNFADLAEEFSNARDYRVELIEVKPGIKCPDCGNMIYT